MNTLSQETNFDSEYERIDGFHEYHFFLKSKKDGSITEVMWMAPVKNYTAELSEEHKKLIERLTKLMHTFGD